MRWIRRLATFIGLLLVLAAALGLWYARQTLPRTDGHLQVSGLGAPVQVNRDGSDVTHILAQNPRDAWMALGYVHAQERGWQLAFNRAVMRGTLSEFLGPATLETDKLMRTLGIRQVAQRQLAKLPADVKAAVEAYSAGINAFFASGEQALTPEFLLLGVNPREEALRGAWWDPADSVGWSIMMALDLGGNWGNEFARLSTLAVLDTPALWELFPPYPGEQPAATADLATLYRSLGLYRPTPVTTSAATPEPQTLAALPALAEHADPDLYRNRQVILTPTEHTLAAHTDRAEQLWRAVGAEVLRMSPQQHDATYAAVSHLPHLLAFAYINGLASQPQGQQFMAMAGPGFRDFSRIAASDPSVWRDILLANRDEVLAQSRHFRAALDVLEQAVSEQRADLLVPLIEQARALRSPWQLPASKNTD